MTLGDIIKEYRTNHGMNIRDFSTRSGLSRAYISILERNVNPKTGKPVAPSIEIIKKVADAIGKDFNEIFSSIDSTTKIIVNRHIADCRNSSSGNPPEIAVAASRSDTSESMDCLLKEAVYISKHENEVLDAYREHTEMQPAVDKLLGVISNNAKYLEPIAAHNDNLDKEQLSLMDEDVEEL